MIIKKQLRKLILVGLLGVILQNKETFALHSPERLATLRGGDLGPIKGESLAVALSAGAAVDAICGAVIPRSSMPP